MKTLKEINAEAKKYAPDDEGKQEAFIQGARYALTGRYYKEAPIFVANTDHDAIIQKLCVPTFEEWWCSYAKKRGRKKAEAKWNKLSDFDKIECMKATPSYVASIEEKQFQKDPLTYLNGECWNDEIINKQNHEQQRTISLASKAARILTDTSNPR